MKRFFSCALSFSLLFAVVAAVSADIVIDGRLTHELEVEPGSTHAGSIVVRNNGSGAEEVKLYQTDYRSTSGGEHFYEDPGTLPRSNADWISFSPNRFSIPAGESYTISYSIRVPLDQSMEGTYWSVLMIEGIPDTSVESSEFDPEQVGIGINTVLRYAFKIVTHVGASGTVDPKITGVAMRQDEGQRTLVVALENIGTRLLRIQVWAELYDGSGEFIGRYDGEYLALYPGSSLPFQINLTAVPAGSYTTLVVVDSGNNNVFGASFPLTLQ